MKRLGYITIFMLMFLVGCLGGQSKKTTSPDCALGQSFDTVSRSCQGAVITNQPPTPTLSSLSILEDSIANTIVLSYSDINSDLAYTCSVTSVSAELTDGPCNCSAGVCAITLTPDPDFNGTGDFFYTVTDDDGVSDFQYVAVTIASVNDEPDVGTVTMTVDEDADLSDIDLTAAGLGIFAEHTLTTATIFDDSHGGAASEGNTPLEYIILVDPSFGVASINPSTGKLDYKPTANSELASGDSIVIGVRDSVMTANGESHISVPITISARTLNPDIPSATTVSYSTELIEDTLFSFDATNGQLGGTEFDSADFAANVFECFIDPSTSDVFQTGTCSCTMNNTTGLAVCDVDVLPKQNIDDGDNPQIEYSFVDTTPAVDIFSSSQTFSIDFVNGGDDDDPVAFATVDTLQGDVEFNELAGPAPPTTPETFTVDSPWDESDTTVTYTITNDVDHGTPSNCMSNNTDRSCEYTPTSGNLENGLALAAATNTFGDLTLTSLVKGAIGNSIDITFTGAPNIGASPQVIVNTTNFQDMTIYIDDGTGPAAVATTSTHVANAIAAHDIAKHIVTPAAGGAVLGAGAVTLLGGADGYADQFTYEATDAAGNTHSNTVNISILGINDKPVMCNYSNYADLNECGGLGCIGASNPADASITPSTHTASKPIIFFNSAEGICWESTSTSAWAIVDDSTDPSHIQDIVVNEGEGIIVIDNFGVDEGGSGSEDNDTLEITSITSDNAILVPSGNVSVYYNDTIIATPYPTSFGAGGGVSEGDGDFRLQVVPQVGNIGTANITIVLSDSSGESSTFTFAVTVQPYSAIHNGWKNITAVGPKFNKFGEIKDSNKKVCSYNLDKCNGGKECTKATIGQSDPTSTTLVTADEANAIYYNADNDTCYYAAAAGTTWTSLETYCAVTPTNLNSNCTGASCVGTTAPAISATELNQSFYDATADVCYRSIAVGGLAADWETYTATSEVTIEWEDFDPVPASESITSYEIYRRLAGETFDYSQKINRSVVDDSITTYVDNAVNSFYPPIPGTVYFYEIRPVIQGVSTNTDEVFKTLRLTSPPDNMVFVHQWMVNKTMCELMHSTTTDPNNDYRCEYEGPGDSGTAPGTNFYDIASDLIVDRFEAGCNYGGAPDCINTSDGACVGINDPTIDSVQASSGAAGTIYYARGNGQCYVSTGATTWTEVDGSTIVEGYVKAYLPPLVNISQSDANDFCGQKTVRANKILGISTCNFSVSGCTGETQDCSDTGTGQLGNPDGTAVTGLINSIYEDAANSTCYINTDGANSWTLINSSLSKNLPSRKQQIAYGLWDTENNTDSAITTLETGLSLNSSAKCNSSQANGLSTNYSDVNSPDSNTLYSLPGTDTSNIRSMITGSEETSTCVSRFGVQDHVGNVSEWTNERFNCLSACPFSRTACDTADSQCSGADPNTGSVVASQGTYYEQGANCFINTDGGSTWVDVTLNVADKYGASFCTSTILADGGQALTGSSNDMLNADGTDQWFQRYILDGSIGPCVDSNSDDACDGGIDSWALEDERNSAGRFIIPMGLPVVTDFNSNFPSSNILAWLFEIGPTSGLTSTQLRDDIVDFDTATIAAETTGCGGMATGGSYLDGSGAGVYALELIPCTDSARSHITVGDITIAQVGTTITPNIEFNNPGGGPSALSVSAAAGGQIIVNLQHDGTSVVSKPSDIVRAINANGTASAYAFAFISGDADNIQSASAQTIFTETNKKDIMVDVGFRCVIPISGYDE